VDISLDELKIIASQKGFDIVLLEKDYLLTKLLFILKDVKDIYFKGGTALNKIFLNHERISEDLDFSLTGNIADIEKEIKNKLEGTIFDKITHDKRVDKFVRLIIHYKLFHETGTIFLDLNERSNMLLKPQKLELPHFYEEHIPEFKVNCLHKNEMIAEKVMATCERYKPRDYFDIYYIIKNNLPISISLIKKKFRKNNKIFTNNLMFKRTNKFFNEWNDDLFKLTKSSPNFNEMMGTLKKFFKYKQ